MAVAAYTGDVNGSTITATGGFAGPAANITGYAIVASTGVGEGTNPIALTSASTSTFFGVSTMTYILRGGRPFTMNGRVQIRNGSGAGRIYSLVVTDNGVILGDGVGHDANSKALITAGDDGTLPYNFSGASSVAGSHTLVLNVSTNGTAANQNAQARRITVVEY